MLVFVRYVLVLLLLFLITFCLTFIYLLRPFHPNNGDLFARAFRFFGFKIMGVKLIYKNFDQLSKSRPCIFIGNHQHNLDFLIFGCNVPKGTLSVGKRSLMYFPFFGWSYFLAGHFGINRSNHKTAVQTMDHIKKVLLKKKCSLLIMPEGTRSHGKGLGPFKKGAFRLAIDAQLNIQPIVVSSISKFVDLNRWKAGHIVMEAISPIIIKGHTMKDLDKIIEETRAKILEALETLNKETEKMLSYSS